MIAVTAVDTQHRPYAYNTQGNHVAFTAPGVNLPLPKPEQGGIGLISGTSFASPYVAGVVALWRKSNRAATSAALINDLARHAIPLGRGGRDPVFGYGLIQAPKGCG